MIPNRTVDCEIIVFSRRSQTWVSAEVSLFSCYQMKITIWFIALLNDARLTNHKVALFNSIIRIRKHRRFRSCNRISRVEQECGEPVHRKKVSLSLLQAALFCRTRVVTCEWWHEVSRIRTFSISVNVVYSDLYSLRANNYCVNEQTKVSSLRQSHTHARVNI